MELRSSGLTLRDAGKWFITTDLFKRDGQMVAGPFSTRADATNAREELEKSTGNLTYWVDHAPRCLVRFSPSEEMPPCR